MRKLISCFILAALLCALLPALGETVPEDAATQIVISFAGDCTLGCDPVQRGQGKSFEAYIDAFGYGYPFEKVKHYFEQDDLTVVNLEGTFYNYEANLKPDVNYHFRGPTHYVNILTEAGIEACSISNNHIDDYGDAGLRNTIQALDIAMIHWFGTRYNDVDGSFIFEKDGVRIGFVAVYRSDWGMPGVKTKIKNHLQTMKDLGCSLLIACMHAGVEYDERHNSAQEDLANALINYGADIVVGTHTHTVQGLREENGVCTLWSLGNFVFGGNPNVRVSQPKNKHYGELNINSVIAQFTLSFDKTGRYLGHQLNLIPCNVSGTTEYNNYQPIPVTGAAADAVIQTMQLDSRDLNLNPYVEGVGAVQDFVPAPLR